MLNNMNMNWSVSVYIIINVIASQQSLNDVRCPDVKISLVIPLLGVSQIQADKRVEVFEP